MITNRAAFGQWNTTAVQGGHFLVGGYPGGFLLDWDPAKPWVATQKGKPGNPQHLTDCDPDLHRPTVLFPHPDGHTAILAGTPDYGYTGGGLLFWDRNKSGADARTLLDARSAPDPLAGLSEREREVLELLVEGLPNKLIARRLEISEKTVKSHLTRIFRELDLTDRTQAALRAERHGVGRRPS